MGIFFDEPKYPVIDKAPSFWRTVGNFNLTDWGVFALCTGGSLPYGWVAGHRTQWGLSSGMARPSMYMAGMIGATAGFMMAYQQSTGRLMGMFPNDKEVESGLARR